MHNSAAFVRQQAQSFRGPTFDSKARGEFFVLFSILEHFSLSFFDKLKGKACYKIVCR